MILQLLFCFLNPFFSPFALTFQLLYSLVLFQYFYFLFFQIRFTLCQLLFMLRNPFLSYIEPSCFLPQLSSPFPFLLLKLLLLLSQLFFLPLPIRNPFFLFSLQGFFSFQYRHTPRNISTI